MKRMLGLLIAVCVLVVSLCGCDRKPPPPKTEQGRVLSVLAVDPNDQQEQQAVTALESARVNYKFRLEVLLAYYEKVGNMDKRNWALRELKNLSEAQTFTWANIPEVLPPQRESLEQADEQALVEYTIAARRRYLGALDELIQFYRRRSPGSYKALRVENIRARFDPVRTYMYFLEAEMPGPDIRPIEVIPEADELYDRAIKLHEQGKGFLRIFVTTSYKKQREALSLLLKLVRKYPRSTKVALAAFYIGEIYKEYFNENVRAVHWYQRAWQWDPEIPKPARFQAAVVWDLRLHQKEKAIECYKAVIEHEQFNKSNVAFARRRLKELMAE